MAAHGRLVVVLRNSLFILVLVGFSPTGLSLHPRSSTRLTTQCNPASYHWQLRCSHHALLTLLPLLQSPHRGRAGSFARHYLPQLHSCGLLRRRGHCLGGIVFPPGNLHTIPPKFGCHCDPQDTSYLAKIDKKDAVACMNACRHVLQITQETCSQRFCSRKGFTPVDHAFRNC